MVYNPNAYFVVVCTKLNVPLLFGHVVTYITIYQGSYTLCTQANLSLPLLSPNTRVCVIII